MQSKLSKNPHAYIFLLIIPIVRIFCFFPGSLIFYKSPLKGLDIPAGQWRFLTAPQIPHEIQCRSCSLIKGKSCYSLGIIHIFLTTVELLSYLNSIQIAIFIQWNTTMKQQIPIVYTVYAAFFIQEFHMIAQYMAVAEGSPQVFHHFLFLFGQYIWLFKVYCWKVRIIQIIFLSFYAYSAFSKVHLIQQ